MRACAFGVLCGVVWLLGGYALAREPAHGERLPPRQWGEINPTLRICERKGWRYVAWVSV